MTTFELYHNITREKSDDMWPHILITYLCVTAELRSRDQIQDSYLPHHKHSGRLHDCNCGGAALSVGERSRAHMRQKIETLIPKLTVKIPKSGPAVLQLDVEVIYRLTKSTKGHKLIARNVLYFGECDSCYKIKRLK